MPQQGDDQYSESTGCAHPYFRLDVFVFEVSGGDSSQPHGITFFILVSSAMIRRVRRPSR